MDRILITLCFIVSLAVAVLAFPDGGAAILLVVSFSIIIIAFIRSRLPEDAEFLQRVFLIGLLLRVIFGAFIYIYDLQSFFGADAKLYDALGYRLTQIWFEGFATNDYLSQRALNLGDSGWGMNYLVAGIYTITGRNPLAAQLLCGVIGALTAPIVYLCAYKVFGSRRVGRTSALLVAVFPAFVIWSSQLLKDGLIIFLLVLAITMILKLQEKFNFVAVLILLSALFGILSLRFYIFYMVVVSVVGSFVIGTSASKSSIARRLAVIIVLGLSLTYIGVIRNATQDIDQYGSLERVQRSRADLSKSESGFGEDLDVSTTSGALAALPIGFTYLMLAPFPWQVNNFRQAIAMPEVIFWWSMLPLMASGLLYTIKHRLRNAIAVLLFSLMLTLAYSIFQGNVGTAYRQRTQIQVFLYMFIAVGWTLRKEKQEAVKLQRATGQEKSER